VLLLPGVDLGALLLGRLSLLLICALWGGAGALLITMIRSLPLLPEYSFEGGPAREAAALRRRFMLWNWIKGRFRTGVFGVSYQVAFVSVVFG